MSHRTHVLMIADQVISINGKAVNIHDIQSIYVNDSGLITDFNFKDDIECGTCKYYVNCPHAITEKREERTKVCIDYKRVF